MPSSDDSNRGTINTEMSVMYPPTGQHVPTVLIPSQAWYQIDPDHSKKINTWKRRFPSTHETSSMQEIQPGIRIYAEEADNTHEAPSLIFALESCLKEHIKKRDHEGIFKFDQAKTAVENIEAVIDVYRLSQVMKTAHCAYLKCFPSKLSRFRCTIYAICWFFGLSSWLGFLEYTCRKPPVSLE